MKCLVIKISFSLKAHVWLMGMCKLSFTASFTFHRFQESYFDASYLLKSFSWPSMISWTAAGSSSVLRSPKPSRSESTTLRSTRRMIFPERVLGNRLANCVTDMIRIKKLSEACFKCKLVIWTQQRDDLPEWSQDKHTWQSFQTPCCSAAWTDPPPVCLHPSSGPRRRKLLTNQDRWVFISVLLQKSQFALREIKDLNLHSII